MLQNNILNKQLFIPPNQYEMKSKMKKESYVVRALRLLPFDEAFILHVI